MRIIHTRCTSVVQRLDDAAAGIERQSSSAAPFSTRGARSMTLCAVVPPHPYRAAGRSPPMPQAARLGVPERPQTLGSPSGAASHTKHTRRQSGCGSGATMPRPRGSRRPWSGTVTPSPRQSSCALSAARWPTPALHTGSTNPWGARSRDGSAPATPMYSDGSSQ